jgi:hypothetical protein
MRSLYRRHIRLQLLSEGRKSEAHGWANVRIESGDLTRRYFKAERGYLPRNLDQEGISSIRRELSKMGVEPESITIKRSETATQTYKNLHYQPEHR